MLSNVHILEIELPFTSAKISFHNLSICYSFVLLHPTEIHV